MTGIVARSGFRFQDLVLVHRVLGELIDLRLAEIGAIPAKPLITYRIEARAASASDDEPYWDLVTLSTVGSSVLEEVKSGPPSAEDRRQLWLRLRRTLNRLGPTRTVIPRLTINKESPPANPQIWRDLRASVRTSPPQQMLRVGSATDLASEALFYLTSPSADDKSTPIPAATAIEVLERFEYADTRGTADLEEQVGGAVTILSKDLAVQAIGDAILGYVGRLAAAKDSPEHELVAADVWNSIEPLRVLSSVSAAAAALWRRLRVEAPPALWAQGQRATTGLQYQNWREVQPALAAIVDGAPPRLAIVGHGGTGKSVALAEICREAAGPGTIVLWLAGADLQGIPPTELRNACDLGRFVCAAFGQKLVLAIDAVENIGNTTHANQLLATIAQVADGVVCRAIAAVRALTWREAAGSQEARSGWVAANLREWDPGLVLTLIEPSQRPGVGADLLKLLRTPLLLDIFLRTFGTAEAIPVGLQSRHALLSVYWNRRVLPEGDPRAPARDGWLASAAQTEADGKTRHTSDGEPARELASEGVIEVAGGAFRFRHALLRDFALMRWCAEGTRNSSEVVSRIRAIRSSLVRWGTLRAGLEAACEGAIDLQELLSTALSDGAVSLSFAEALGDLDDPSVLPIATISSALDATLEGGALLHRCLTLAVLSTSGGWMQLLSRFPDTAQWAEAKPWITGEVLDQVVSLVHAVHAAGFAPPEVLGDVAIRVREWSQAPRLSEAVREFNGFLLQRAIFCVAEFAPSAQTVKWMTEIAGATWRSRFAVLHSLPVLVGVARARCMRLEKPQLQALYLAASGLVWRDAGLEDDASARAVDGADYDRVQVPLLGRDAGEKGRGLLQARPDSFMDVALGILIGKSRARERESKERWASAAASQAALGDFRPFAERPDIQEAIERLDGIAGSKLSREETTGALEDDLYGTEYDHPHESVEEALAAGIREQFVRALREGSDDLLRVYMAAVEVSPTTVGRLIALDCLVEEKRCEELRGFILDKRLLHNWDTHYWVCAAVKLCWETLSEGDRALLLDNIRSLTRSPTVTAFGVARVLSAVPPHARPSDLVTYLDLWGLLGEDPAPQKPEWGRHGAEWMPVPEPEREPLEGLDAEADDAWHELRTAAKGLADRPDKDAKLREVLELLIAAIQGGQPSPGSLGRQRWPLSVAQSVLSQAVRSVELQRTSTVSREDALVVLSWAVSIARAVPSEDLNKDPSPLEVANSSSDYDVWTEALDLADDALWIPSIRDDDCALRFVFEEVGRVVPGATPKTARKAFHTISWTWWVSPPGVPVLEALLGITDAGALYWALPILGRTDEGEQLKWLRRWLTRESGVERSKGAERFAHELGHYLGASALYRINGEKNALRVLAEELLVTKPGAGLLGEASRYVTWCSGLVVGAKEFVSSNADEEVAEFASLVRAAWRASLLVSPESAGKDQWTGRFGLFTIHWLLDDAKGGAKGSQRNLQRAWAALNPVVSEMIAEGERPDVFDLVFALREGATVDRLGAESLVGVAHAISNRAAREGPDSLRKQPSQGHTWLEVLEYASEMLEAVGSAPRVSDEEADGLHTVLQEWGRLGVARAIRAARGIRNARGRG